MTTPRPDARGRFAPAPVALAAALLLTAACGKKAPPPAPPVPVLAGEAVQKDVPVVLTAIGTVEPLTTVTVRAQVGGTLERVHFQEGQEVLRGDLLFTIDPRPYQAALRQAEANLARDRAKEASARAESQRYAELVKKEYVTRQQYDDAVAAAESGAATVQGDEAAVESARLALAYCSIRAPMDARTGNVLVHAGNLVSPGDPKGLVVLNQIAPVCVSFSAPESRLAELRQAAAAGSLAVTATPPGGAPVAGELTFFNNAVDETTGTLMLKATFPNADRVLWPGQFVNAALTLSVRRGAVTVPVEAIQAGQQGEFVFVIRPDSYVDIRPVTTGPRLAGDIVVERGLSSGDRVVTDGQLRLVPFEAAKAKQDRATRVEVKAGLAGAAPQGAAAGAPAGR